MEQASVVALFRKLKGGGVVAVDQLEAVAGQGFVGDRTYGAKSRQVLFVSKPILDQLGYQPGTLREQVTVDDASLQNLEPGSRVQVGQVIVEITQDCEPCGKMARNLGEDPKEFMQKTEFKRGMLGKVVTDGVIRVGDAFRRLDAS
jgi:MOSC domain-containing protein YiiM